MKTLPLVFIFFFPFSVHAGGSLGDFTGFTRNGNVVLLRASESSVNISFYAKDVVRVDLLPFQLAAADSSFAVIRDVSADIPVTILETDSSLTISSQMLRVRCRKFPLRLAFIDSSGRELVAEPFSGGMAAQGEERIARFSILPDVHFYGTGERGTRLDRRGLVILRRTLSGIRTHSTNGGRAAAATHRCST